MKLDRVTITGADDSIEPNDLIALTEEFPFVEWGILASESSTGRRTRYPSWEWMIMLQSLASKHPMKLSLHLCGKWVRQLLLGHRSESLTDAALFLFQRSQLNFHAENAKCDQRGFCKALETFGDREIIFQIDGNSGNAHMESLWDECDRTNTRINSVSLFDISGGAGILPGEWPKPTFMIDDETYAYHGYAGGLGPDNLQEQIPLIGEAAGDARFWIDMETKVRSDNDRRFDLDKVRQCLEIAKPFIKG